jgi:hypothetical protein
VAAYRAMYGMCLVCRGGQSGQEEEASQPTAVVHPTGMRTTIQWYVAAYTNLHR